MKNGLLILWGYVRIGLIGAFILLGMISFVHFAGKSDSPKAFVAPKNLAHGGEFKIIDWSLLAQLNYRSGEASAELKALDGKQVKIPGFIVPLEDSQNQISEFLLVPSPQSCIHVPPPPANQMIYVKMDSPVRFEWGYRAYWIMGNLNLKSVASPYGSVSFEMLGQSVKPFNFQKQNM